MVIRQRVVNGGRDGCESGCAGKITKVVEVRRLSALSNGCNIQIHVRCQEMHIWLLDRQDGCIRQPEAQIELRADHVSGWDMLLTGKRDELR